MSTAQVFGQVSTLHAVGFALTLLIMLVFGVFMLRPLLTAASGETRRIAELLSQLPKEIDIEAVVQEVLAAEAGSSAASAPPPAAALQAEVVSMLAGAPAAGSQSGALAKSPSVTMMLPHGPSV